MFGWFGLNDSALSVIEAIETVSGQFLNRSQRNWKNGFSVKLTSEGVWRLSVFVLADELFNSGVQTRTALLACAEEFNLDLTSYAAFSSGAQSEIHANRHLMLAFTPLPDGQVDLRFGLSPELQNKQ